MLGHWLEKEHWLENVESWHLKKEIWDGNRWSELQWFGNPENVWVLPPWCVHCNIPISTDHLINSPDCDRQGAFKIVECPVCLENFEHCIKMAKGSPLNLALIGHFDGWQPFGRSYRGSGSFEVTVANMRKTQRNHVDEVYVVGFVPCFEVPNLPESLDPFLEPFTVLPGKKLCECYYCAGQLTTLVSVKQGSFWTKGSVDVVGANW